MTIKIVLSSPLRTLPQSLRDSSLPEGAFEKFSAITFVLAVYLQTCGYRIHPCQNHKKTANPVNHPKHIKIT